MRAHLKQLIHSPSSYPITAVYVAGVVLAYGISDGYVALSIGLLLFSIVAVLAISVALLREIRGVRLQLALVTRISSHQQVELQERIDALIEALLEAGEEIPPRGKSKRH